MNAFKRVHFESIDSTNEYCKSKREERENLLVTADFQTGGRGTKGRSFVSAKGGVYLSKLCFYEKYLAKDAFLIMAGAAVAVCRTLKFFGLHAEIKWANDVFVNGKKICGILIENVFSGSYISSSIVGVGVNVYNVLPSELLEIATTMQQETGKIFSVEEVKEKLIQELCKPTTIEEYRSFLGFLDKEVKIITQNGETLGKILGVDEDGALWAETENGKEKFYSGEVSLRV